MISEFFLLIHSFFAEFQFAKTRFTCSNSYWGCEEQSQCNANIRIILLEDRFCECHLGDQYLMLTKHLLRLLIKLSTSDKISAKWMSTLYFNAKSAADFYISSTDLIASASLVTWLKSSQSSLSFSNLHRIRPKMTSHTSMGGDLRELGGSPPNLRWGTAHASVPQYFKK